MGKKNKLYLDFINKSNEGDTLEVFKKSKVDLNKTNL